MEILVLRQFLVAPVLMFMGWICGKVPRCRIICIVIAKDQKMFLPIVIGIFDYLERWLSDYEFLEIELRTISK